MHVEFFHLFAKREEKEMDHNQIPQSSLLNSCFFFSSPKPRIRWDSDLHDQFVMAVTRLGGPNEAKPTAIKQTMEAMGVHGLTLRHVKSHLQKYRASCKSGEGNEEKEKEAPREISGGSNAESHIYLNPVNTEEKDVESDVSGVNSESTSQGTSLQLQEEVEKHLELRKAAQDKYMNSILERAYDKVVAEFLN